MTATSHPGRISFIEFLIVVGILFTAATLMVALAVTWFYVVVERLIERRRARRWTRRGGPWIPMVVLTIAAMVIGMAVAPTSSASAYERAEDGFSGPWVVEHGFVC